MTAREGRQQGMIEAACIVALPLWILLAVYAHQAREPFVFPITALGTGFTFGRLIFGPKRPAGSAP